MRGYVEVMGKSKLSLLAVMVLLPASMRPQPQGSVMTNGLIQQMLRGGIPLGTITQAIRTAARVELYMNDQETNALITAGASSSDASEIMKAIHDREYIGRSSESVPDLPAWLFPPPTVTTLSSSPVSILPTSPSSHPLSLRDLQKSVQYDPRKWQQYTELTDDRRLLLRHRNGDGAAVVGASRIVVPLESVPDLELAFLRRADPGARITFKERRQVNGTDVMFLKAEATVKGILFSYYTYFYNDGVGSHQILATTGRNLIDEYDRDFMEILNGLRPAK